MIYILEHNGIQEYWTTNFTYCLKHLAKCMGGRMGNVTVKQAIEAGWKVRVA